MSIFAEMASLIPDATPVIVKLHCNRLAMLAFRRVAKRETCSFPTPFIGVPLIGDIQQNAVIEVRMEMSDGTTKTCVGERFVDMMGDLT